MNQLAKSKHRNATCTQALTPIRICEAMRQREAMHFLHREAREMDAKVVRERFELGLLAHLRLLPVQAAVQQSIASLLWHAAWRLGVLSGVYQASGEIKYKVRR